MHSCLFSHFMGMNHTMSTVRFNYVFSREAGDVPVQQLSCWNSLCTAPSSFQTRQTFPNSTLSIGDGTVLMRCLKSQWNAFARKQNADVKRRTFLQWGAKLLKLQAQGLTLIKAIQANMSSLPAPIVLFTTGWCTISLHPKLYMHKELRKYLEPVTKE